MKIRQLFSNRKRWMQRGYFQIKGYTGPSSLNVIDAILIATTYPKDIQAQCLIGACIRCYPKNWKSIESQIQIELSNRGYGGSVATWNDDPQRTFSQVRALVEEMDI